VPNPNKVALIIGIDKYYNNDLEQLPSCKKDAEDLFNLLSSEKFDYTVFMNKPILGSNVDTEYGWAHVQKAISNFFSSAKPSQILLFYFSGHGITKANDVYLSTPQVNPKGPFPEGLALSNLTTLMGDSKSRQIVGIIDACYSGAADIPNKGLKKKSAAEGEADIALANYDKIWKKTRKTKGIALLLSSQSYETSNAQQNSNSLYTKHLIQGLMGVKPTVDEETRQPVRYSGSVDYNGYITPESLHEYIYGKVANETDQIPDIKVDRASTIILAYHQELDTVVKLQQGIDLSKWVTIHDQGPQATAAAFAAITAMETSLAKQGKPLLLSARYVYEKTKQHDELPRDAGTWLTTVAYVIEQFGAPLESAWPYKAEAKVNWKKLDINAQYYKANVFRLNSVKDILSYLRMGRPIIAGLQIYEHWFDSKTGIIPHPSKSDGIVGGHAITIVGYDPRKSEIRFANSWGISWGNRGFGSMEEKVLEKLQMVQMYAIEVPINQMIK
jgi:C1A family cysteine protease